MGKMFEALKKAEKERDRILKEAGNDPSALNTEDREVDPHVVAFYDRMSPITDQYRGLVTSLANVQRDQPPTSMVVTSALEGEGKTITALNLAVTLAEDEEKRVALVDADLHSPAVHRLCSVDNQRGLSDYLEGTVMLELVLQRWKLQNLSILPAGRLPGNPTELLAGPKTAELLTRLTRDFDYVVVDAPSVLKQGDVTVLANGVDGALFVVKMGVTPRAVVMKGLDLLDQNNVPVLGTVATHLDADSTEYYYSTYN